MTGRRSAALAWSRLMVRVAAPIVPRRRRPEWQRQWDADLLHQWRFLAARQAGWRSTIDLVSRARGVFRHAFLLRLRSLAMPSLIADVRYGVRSLLSRPGFTLTAVLLLAFGIGATTTIFSWTEGLVLEPIAGVSDSSSLISIHGTTRTRRDISLSYPNFADTRDRAPASLAGMTAGRLVAMNMRVGDGPERVWGELVTADFFSVLGVGAAVGRVLVPDDDRAPGASAVVVLSHGFWERRFDADPSVVGATTAVNGTPFTIVGVAAAGFRGSSSAMSVDVWVPMMMQRSVRPGDLLTARGDAWLNVIGRLAPGATVEQAQQGLDLVAASLAAEHPGVNTDRGVAVYPLWRDPSSPAGILGPVLAVLLGVVGVVLVIVCANLASLLLARASGRQREIAVRVALGAGRVRVIRQLVTESVLLALAGGIVGLAIALWASQLIVLFVPPTPQPITTEVDVSLRVPLVSVLLALVTTVLFGLVPAWQASRPALVPALKDARGTVGVRRAWARHALVVGQVALSVVLLVAAALFVRTLGNAAKADVGFDLEDGLLASLDLQSAGYDRVRGTLFYQQLLREVGSLPGVASAGIARDIPLKLGNGSDTSGDIEGYEPAKGEEIVLGYDRVSPGYLETLGVPLVAGRLFTDQDDATRPGVVVINQTMARRYWKDGDAIGKRINLGEWVTVIGIVGDLTYTTVGAPPMAFMYMPLYWSYRPDTTLVIRTDGAGVSDAELRAAVRRVDPNVPLFDVRSMAQHKQIVLFLPRMAASMLGSFGLVALGLATVGLYGLLAFVVGQRVPEIGVRIALGASRGSILRLVVGQGLRLAIVGAAIGFTLAFLLLPLVSSQLVGVGARDVVAYSSAALLLVAAAGLACYLPARRAAGIDPIRALRYE